MKSTHENPVIEGAFVKSTLSDNSGNCVEVAPTRGGGRAVRDSKDPSGPVLYFTPSEWSAFLGGVKLGEFS
ncbi:DUF397 domain-containing protein [Streptosporangium amethystogenes subsp. fukuiense]|uniref:DUF397 domain-containing protein n=1 Tax=Streptosporangium amethystogenes subsp. fukuiense TaxID=698418 RepID=A0ABW2T6A4_9ACTN